MRLEYAADLARRRYEQVDPANRLVAQTLETEWNQRLEDVETARQAYAAQRPTAQNITSTAAQMQAAVAQLQPLWYGENVNLGEKKELLRCVVEQVFLESRGQVIGVRVGWYGGAVSELEVPKYLFSAPQLYHCVRDLAQTQTDAEIATQLNQRGLPTVKDKPWTARRVMDFRRSNGIPSGFTTTAALRLPETGYLTSAEVAQRLGVSQSTVQKWYRLGLLSGKHDGGPATLWIRWTDDLGQRLLGAATPDPRMVSMRALCQAQGQHPDAVLAWAQQHGHAVYRLRRGTSVRFYVLPAQRPVPLQ